MKKETNLKQEKAYHILQNDADELLITIIPRDVEPKDPEIIYDGKDHALLYRDPKHTIVLDFIHKDAQPLLKKAKKVLLAEFNPSGSVEHEYEVPVYIGKVPLPEEFIKEKDEE